MAKVARKQTKKTPRRKTGAMALKSDDTVRVSKIKKIARQKKPKAPPRPLPNPVIFAWNLRDLDQNGGGWKAPTSFVIRQNGAWIFQATFCKNENQIVGSGERPNVRFVFTVVYYDAQGYPLRRVDYNCDEEGYNGITGPVFRNGRDADFEKTVPDLGPQSMQQINQHIDIFY